MIYIVLATFTSVLMFVIVRLFENYRAHTLYALMFNYLSAFLAGLWHGSLYLSSKGSSFFQSAFVLPKSVWGLTLTEGILFIIVFYWISQTIRYYGMAVASVANKMSLIFPVLSAHILFAEPLGFARWIGLAVAVLSVYMVTYSDDIKSISKTSNIIFPLLVFFGSGLVDSIINYGHKTYINTADKQLVFSTFVYLFALLTGFVLLLTQKKYFQQTNIRWTSTIIGIGN